MLRGARDPEFYGLVMPDDIPGGIPGGLFVERAAAHGVAEIVAENGDALHLADMIPHGPFFRRQGRVGRKPAFAVYKDRRVDLRQFFPDAVHRFDVVYSHQVEPESVDMVLLRPEFDGFDDVMPYHFAFRSRLIAAARGVRVGTVGILAVKVTGDGKVEVRTVDRGRVVVDHVEDDAHPVPMQAFHHLLELADACHGVGRIGGVTAFRNVVVLRVVSPVVGLVRQPRLVHRRIVEGGEDVYMRYAQFLEMIQTGCLPFGGFGAGFGQGQKFALVADSGIRGDAEIAVVQFVENNVGIHFQFGRTIRFPAFRIGLVPVDHGRPVAVYADRLGPDAGRFVQPFPLFLDLEGVESPFQIALRRDAPCSVVGGPHLQPLLRFPAFARSVEVQPDLVGRGRPKRKDGTLRGVCQFQIAPVIAGISVERIGLSGRWMVFLSRHGMFFRSSEFAYRLRLPVRRRLFPRRPDARAACVWGRRM